MALVMCLSLLPAQAMAEGIDHVHNQDGWQCTWVDPVTEPDCQHTEHTPDCGYVAPVEEIPCTCTPETDEATGEIVHAPDCAYRPADAGQPCTHECGDECVKVVREGYYTNCKPPQAVENEVPAEVQAFLDAMAVMPQVTQDNALELFERLGNLSDGYALALEVEDEDVQAACRQWEADYTRAKELAGYGESTYELTVELNSGLALYELQTQINAASESEIILLLGGTTPSESTSYTFTGTLTIPTGKTVTVKNTAIWRGSDTGYKGPLFRVEAGATLNLEDMALHGTESEDKCDERYYEQPNSNKLWAQGPLVEVCDNGILNLNRGAYLHGNGHKGNGGGVLVRSGGTLNFYEGASIVNCDAIQGGAVYVEGDGHYNDYGGISDGCQEINVTGDNQLDNKKIVVTVLTSSNIPGEPSVSKYPADAYTWVTSTYTVGYTNEAFSDNAASYIRKEIFNDPNFAINGGAQGVGSSAQTYLSNINWDRVCEAVAEKGNVTTTNGVTLTTSNQGSYTAYPYVAKLQDDGWHIDCVIVPRNQPKLTYELNLRGYIDNLNGFEAPSGKTYAEGTTVTVDSAKYNNQLVKVGEGISVKKNDQSAKLYFLGWSTSSAGSAVYEPNDTFAITGDTTLYGVWSTEKDTYKLTAEGKDIHTTYNGQEHTIKIKVTDAATGELIKEPTIEYFSEEACKTPIANSFTDACAEQTIWIKVSKEGYAPVTTSVQVKIEPAPLTVKVEDAPMTYGDDVPEVKYTVVSGEQNDEKAAFSSTLSWKGVGDKPNAATYSSEGTLTMVENGTFKPSNYELSLTQGTLTVGKRSVTLTSADASKPYDGTPLTKTENDDGSPVITVSGRGWAFGEGATYKVTGSQTIAGTGKNTFEYTLIDGAVQENYEIYTKYGDLVVTPRGSDKAPKYQITVRANSLEATYNGSEFSCGGLETTLFKLENGQEYRVEGLEAATQTATDANGEGVPVTVTTKAGYEEPIVRDSEGNDVTDSFVVDTDPGKLVIKRREITLTAGSASKPYDGTPLTCSTFTVTSGSFVGDDAVDCEFSGSVTRVGTGVNEITSCTAKAGTSTNPNNYDINLLPGTLTVTALDDATRIPITVTAGSAEVPYSGEKQSVTTFTVDGATNNVITVNDEKFTVVTTGLAANGEGINAGEYPVKVSGSLKVMDGENQDVSDQFKLAAVDGTLKICEADLKLTSPNGEKVYDGTPLTANNLSEMKIEGLKDADKAKLHIEITGTQTVPTTDGGVDNTFTYSFDDGAEKNYKITATCGKLKVTSRGEDDHPKYEITLVPRSASYVYNGQEQKIEGFATSLQWTNPEGRLYTITNVTASASGKDFKEGGYPVSVKVGDTEVTDFSQPLTGVVVKDDQDNDVSSQFIVKVEPAALVIQKAPLTLISKTLSKPYDATELTNGNEPMQVESGWVNGEGKLVTYEFTGSVQNPNQTADNAFDINWNGVNKENYALDQRAGKLSISSRTAKFEVTLTGASSADSKDYIYDGTEKSVSGFVGQETRTIKGQSVVCVPVEVTIDNREVPYYVTGLTSEATGINVSDSKETSINGTAVVYDADGNDVSSEFTVKPTSGKLTIKPRTVTLTSQDCTKVYDGTALTNDKDIVVSGNGWAVDEGADYKFTGSRTLVGDSPNAFSYTLQGGTDAGNYTISTVEGKLVVTAPDEKEVVEVQIEDVHRTYDGTTQTWEQKDLTFKWHDQTYTLVGSTVTASGKDYDANGYQMSVTGVENPVIHDSSGETVEGVFQIVVKEGSLFIDKRAVTVESGSGTWEYDGSTHTNHDVKVTSGSFVAGEEPAYTFDPTASQTLVGGDAENNIFTCTPPAGKDSDLYTKNYDITYTYGMLKVIGRTEKYPYRAYVSVDPVTYDGQPHEAKGSKTEEITRNGITYWVTYTWDSGKWTDVKDGGYELTTTCTVYDAPENGNDVTSQFAPEITAGNLVINPASLAVKVTFEDRAYDGSTDVKVKDVSITGGKVDSDDVAVQFKPDAAKTGTVESGAASEEPKAVLYKDIKDALELSGGKKDNYVIDKVELGTVTIGKAEPTVSLQDTEVTYNGKPAEVKADVALVNGEKYEGEISYTYYSGQDGREPLTGAPTNAGTYYVKASIAASGNYKAAASNIVSLVIKPAPLTVTVAFADRAYDGSTAVNASGVSITSGKVEDDDVAAQFKDDAAKTGTIEDGTASEESKTVSYKDIKDALELTGIKSGNYVIDKVELGTVTISKATVTVTADNKRKIYDGYPFPTANFTYTLNGFVPGEDWTSAGVEGSVSYTGNAVGAVNVDTYTITPVVSGLSATNYSFEAASGTLTISAQSYIPPYNPTPIPTPTPTPVNPTPTPTPGGTTITDEETPLAGAVGLNDTDHFAYIAGYENDTVRPTKNISRAEVATIFFRLMTEEFRVANWATENDLKDVQTADWYNNAVSTCANAGIITGYTDGRFQPQKDITRAEFAVIAARFLGPDADDEGAGDFSDTADHWAAAEIRKAAKAGWITGDGNKFRPNDPITRAEVMVIVNRMLDRTPDAGHMLPDMKTWIDNPEGTWYYEAVQEATNGHDYERDELNVETWTAIQTGKNWKAIEAEWAANNGASAPRDDAEPVEADGESK